jgi:hypothetical protein
MVSQGMTSCQQQHCQLPATIMMMFESVESSSFLVIVPPGPSDKNRQFFLWPRPLARFIHDTSRHDTSRYIHKHVFYCTPVVLPVFFSTTGEPTSLEAECTAVLCCCCSVLSRKKMRQRHCCCLHQIQYIQRVKYHTDISIKNQHKIPKNTIGQRGCIKKNRKRTSKKNIEKEHQEPQHQTTVLNTALTVPNTVAFKVTTWTYLCARRKKTTAADDGNAPRKRWPWTWHPRRSSHRSLHSGGSPIWKTINYKKFIKS